MPENINLTHRPPPAPQTTAVRSPAARLTFSRTRLLLPPLFQPLPPTHPPCCQIPGSASEFFTDMNLILRYQSLGPVKSFCHQRLMLLEQKFNLHGARVPHSAGCCPQNRALAVACTCAVAGQTWRSSPLPAKLHVTALWMHTQTTLYCSTVRSDDCL